MDFRKSCVGMVGGVAEEKVPVVLPARSLLIMTGASRYQWTHAIATRHYDQLPSPEGFTAVPRGTRLSLTLRAVRQPPCICQCGKGSPLAVTCFHYTPVSRFSTLL